MLFRSAGVLALIGVVGIAGLNLGGYNVVPYNFGTWRIAGVLQRISACYLIASLIFLHLSWRRQVVLSIVLLLGYWALMTLVPVPGCEITSINDKACNLAAYVDRMVITEPHIWRAGKVYDPEGLLSTIPAIVTTISGILTGLWLRARPSRTMDNGGVETPAAETTDNEFRLNKVAGMFFFGAGMLALGLIWNSYFPMNKSLWTSSYVVATTGLALLTLGTCYWLIDVKGYEKWAWPFRVFGANALALFVFTGIFARMIAAYRVTGEDGQLISVQRWIMQHVYLAVAQPIDASWMRSEEHTSELQSH